MLSRTVEYALRAIVFLASRHGQSASAHTIARATRVPRRYLQKVMDPLAAEGLVSARRGPGGGFTLARAPREITMLEVVAAVDPIERIHECPLGRPGHMALCPLHRRLDAAARTIEEAFADTSLADILADEAGPGDCQGVADRATPATLTVKRRRA